MTPLNTILIYHLIDVLSMAEVIWDYYLTHSVKEEVADDMDLSVEESRIWMILASLHDIGKASPGFQGKNEFLKGRLREIGYQFSLACEDHRIMTAHFVGEMFSDGETMPKLDPYQRHENLLKEKLK
ncbi:MAG: HD domain-containing protein [Methanomassiliicoccales archaeon]